MVSKTTIGYIALDLISNIFAAYILINSYVENEPISKTSAICLGIWFFFLSIGEVFNHLSHDDSRKQESINNRALVTAFVASQKKNRPASATSYSGTGYDSEVTSDLLEDQSSSMRG